MGTLRVAGPLQDRLQIGRGEGQVSPHEGARHRHRESISFESRSERIPARPVREFYPVMGLLKGRQHALPQLFDGRLEELFPGRSRFEIDLTRVKRGIT